MKTCVTIFVSFIPATAQKLNLFNVSTGLEELQEEREYGTHPC